MLLGFVATTARLVSNSTKAALAVRGRSGTRTFLLLELFLKFGKLPNGDLFLLIQNLRNSFDFLNLSEISLVVRLI